MQNRFPLWKYILLIVILIVGILYALPNVFMDEPAIQISPKVEQVTIDNNFIASIKQNLAEAGISYKSIQQQNNLLLIRFDSVNHQLEARSAINKLLANNNNYTLALNLAPTTPKWLSALGAHPMKLGLDLRGGVHFLLDVDMTSVFVRRIQNFAKSFSKQLRDANIRYRGVFPTKQNITLQFDDAESEAQAYGLIQRSAPEFSVKKQNQNGNYVLLAEFTPQAIGEISQYTIEQTMTTLRNRVNELGVAEAQVQQQGSNRIAVDLPGIQDAAHAKQILGGTATLAFHLVDFENDARSVAASGAIPLGTKLYQLDGQPILVKNQAVLTGDAIISAQTGLDENGMPAVNISIGGNDAALFSRATRENVGKRLAIVYIETVSETQVVNGKPTKVHRKIERVISAPQIQTTLGSNFRITGLSTKEAQDLALLLRAGSLPAAIDVVEEQTVGPSLGAENIKNGINSLVIGMTLVIIFMALYYRVFGLIADLALIFDLVLIVAVLSIAGATLTLSGIAGIVLTVGMAVDSNVLIFERIREELRNGVSPQASIHAGFERALATIIDSNVTTLIVAIVLFSIGSGAVRGFAITLTIGILTSMLTAVTFTRAIVNMVWQSIEKNLNWHIKNL